MNAKNRGAGGLISKMALRAGPQFALAVRPKRGQTRMWFDIALVCGGGCETVLDNQVSFGKPGGQVAMLIFMIAHNIRVQACGHRGGGCAFTNDGRARLHCFVDIGDVGQGLIRDLYQLRRIASD